MPGVGPRVGPRIGPGAGPGLGRRAGGALALLITQGRAPGALNIPGNFPPNADPLGAAPGETARDAGAAASHRCECEGVSRVLHVII